MYLSIVASLYLIVAPHAGAWIEIVRQMIASSYIESRPTRARGLK